MSFAETLKYLREENQITQKELAHKCKLSPQCICNLEQGLRNPTGSTVVVLAQFFGVSADYLLGLEDDFGVRTAAPMGNNVSFTEKEKALLRAFKNMLPETQDFVLRSVQSLSDTDSAKTLKKS